MKYVNRVARSCWPRIFSDNRIRLMWLVMMKQRKIFRPFPLIRSKSKIDEDSTRQLINNEICCCDVRYWKWGWKPTEWNDSSHLVCSIDGNKPQILCYKGLAVGFFFFFFFSKYDVASVRNDTTVDVRFSKSLIKLFSSSTV